MGRLLDGLGLARFFPADAVLGGDGPFPRKPDPTALRHLTAALGASAETTMMVGDSAIDWRTARAAQTPVCLARYGFGFDGIPLDELGPDDRVIESSAALLQL